MSLTPQERARTLAIAQDFGTEALELNRQLVAADPGDTASRTRLGRCLVQAGRLDDAESEYREALRLDPRNRVASGGLETIERLRHQGDAIEEPPRARHAERPRRAAASGAVPAARAPRPPAAVGAVPRTFTGFGRRDFTELQVCPRNEVQARFGPRVVDLVRRVNALQSSIEISNAREPGHRQLFRASRADVHTRAGQWFVHHAGGRWEAQFTIGMYAGADRTGDWLRVGLGFDLSERGNDPDPAAGMAQARDQFRSFQSVLESPRRSLFLGWMIKENGLVEYNGPGPRLDLRDPVAAADFLARADAERTSWAFLGKWLSPEHADDEKVLADPVALVRTIDRAWTGLMPLWRAVRGSRPRRP